MGEVLHLRLVLRFGLGFTWLEFDVGGVRGREGFADRILVGAQHGAPVALA